MRSRAITTDRLILVLGVIVLMLGGGALWAATHSWRLADPQPSPSERALSQLREIVGGQVEITDLEIGKGRAVCGYVGDRDGSGGPIFISRPNRLMLSTDPLRIEFDQTLKTACPGFLKSPPLVT
jgi:hypothetical protein